MDLGRVGLFVVIGAVSIFYGLSRGQTTMMIIGLLLALAGIVNAVVMGKKNKDNKEGK